jgi:hypothetical protein
MPQASTFTLTKSDGTTTYDFNVSKRIGETVWFRNSSEASTSAGQPELSVTWSGAIPQRKTNKCVLRYSHPIEHTVDGVVRVDDTPRASADLRLPETMTAAQRADFWAGYLSFLNAQAIEDMVEDAEALY